MNAPKPSHNLVNISLAPSPGVPTLQFYYPESETIVSISCVPQLGIVTTKLDCLQYRVLVTSNSELDVGTAKYYTQRAVESLDMRGLVEPDFTPADVLPTFLVELPQAASSGVHMRFALCVRVSNAVMRKNLALAKLEAESAKIISDLLAFDEADLAVANDAVAGNPKTGA